MLTEWQRPKTTRTYIHPPKSERFFTLWRDGKIVFGENTEPIRRPYTEIISRGLWFVYGNGEISDFHTAEYVIPENGIPVHGLRNNYGELAVEIETFASFERCSTCYIKAVAKNNSEKAEKFGFMIRTAREDALCFAAPDVYESYKSNLDVWKGAPSTFKYDGKVLRDGEYYLTAPGLDWDENQGIASVTIAPGEEKTLIMSFGKGETFDFDYESEEKKCVDAWENELKKIDRLPESIKSNPEIFKTIQNLTVQMLQCFTTTIGTNNIYPRQGGLQRQIWTGEADAMIKAMCKIGSFQDYLDPVMELYFNTFQQESGEMVPFGISWAMATATVLFTYAIYAESEGKEVWDKYCEQAYKAFKWMKETRVKETYVDEKGNTILKGLFPPRRSCDDELVFQAWTLSDSANVRGLDVYLAAAERFGDPHVDEIREEYENYKATLREYFRDMADKQENKDEIEVCYSLTDPNEEMDKKFAFRVTAPMLLHAIKATKEETESVLNHCRKDDMIKGGLYNRMKDTYVGGTSKFNLDENGKCVVWYVCCEEVYLYQLFMNYGDRERAEEIIRDNAKYAMSDEYYMQERYNKNDPYFTPWMPNASANGRMVDMIVDFYK